MESMWPGRVFMPVKRDIKILITELIQRIQKMFDSGTMSYPTRTINNKTRHVFKKKDELFTPKAMQKLWILKGEYAEFNDDSRLTDVRADLIDTTNFAVIEVHKDSSFVPHILSYFQLLLLWKYTMLEDFLNYPRSVCVDIDAWKAEELDEMPLYQVPELMHAFYGITPHRVASGTFVAGVVLKLRKVFMANGVCIYDSESILSHQPRELIRIDLASVLVYEQLEIAAHDVQVTPPSRNGLAYTLLPARGNSIDQQLKDKVLRIFYGVRSDNNEESPDTWFPSHATTAFSVQRYYSALSNSGPLATASVLVYSVPSSRHSIKVDEKFSIPVGTKGLPTENVVCSAVLAVLMDSLVIYQQPSMYIRRDIIDSIDDMAIVVDVNHFLDTVQRGVDWRLLPTGCGGDLMDAFKKLERIRSFDPIVGPWKRDESTEAKDLTEALLFYQQLTSTHFPLLHSPADTPFLKIKIQRGDQFTDAPSDSEESESSMLSYNSNDVSSVSETSRIETIAKSSRGGDSSQSQNSERGRIPLGQPYKLPNGLEKMSVKNIKAYLKAYQNGRELSLVNKLRTAENIVQFHALASVAIHDAQSRMHLAGRYRTLENCLLGYGAWNGDAIKSQITISGMLPIFETTALPNYSSTQSAWRHSLFALSLVFYLNLSFDSTIGEWSDTRRAKELDRRLEDFMLYRPRVDVWFLHYFDIVLMGDVNVEPNALGRLIRELDDPLFVVEPTGVASSRILRYDRETGEETDYVDVSLGLYISDTRIPLLAPSVASDLTEYGLAATFLPITVEMKNNGADSAPKGKSQILRAFAGALYWTCVLANTDALRLYGPVAIASMVLGTWRDASDNSSIGALPIFDHVRHLFLDDCGGPETYRRATGVAMVKEAHSENIRRLLLAPSEYFRELRTAHPLYTVLADERVEDLFKKCAELDITSGEIIGIDGPRFIRDVFSLGCL